MSKCQPQSCFPPRQGHLQWASGEVACPAAVFTVLRRRREPDLGRPGWAAPLGPCRVHTHFPENEHHRPACCAESSSPATHPLRVQPLGGKFPGKLWEAAGPRKPEPGWREPGTEGERKGCPPSRQVQAVLPWQVCIPCPSVQVQVLSRTLLTCPHSAICVHISQLWPMGQILPPPVSEDCLFTFFSGWEGIKRRTF